MLLIERNPSSFVIGGPRDVSKNRDIHVSCLDYGSPARPEQTTPGTAGR